MIKVRQLVVALAAILVGMLLPIFGGTASAEQSGSYIHSNANPNQVFDDRAFQGTDLWTYQLNGGSNQRWISDQQVPGVVRLSSEANPGRYVTADEFAGPLTLDRDRGGDPSQLWQVHELSSDQVMFESMKFRGQMISYVRNNGSAELRPYAHADYQIWEIQ